MGEIMLNTSFIFNYQQRQLFKVFTVEQSSLWRNWLMHAAVNLKVGGLSPPVDDGKCLQ